MYQCADTNSVSILVLTTIYWH